MLIVIELAQNRNIVALNGTKYLMVSGLFI